MLSPAVVALNPGHDDAFGLLEGLEVMQPDTFLLQGPEASLDHPVVLRRGAGDELLGDRELLSGTDKAPGQEDGAVVVPKPQARGHLAKTPLALDDPLLQRINGLHGPALMGEPSAHTFAAPGIENAHEREAQPSWPHQIFVGSVAQSRSGWSTVEHFTHVGVGRRAGRCHSRHCQPFSCMIRCTVFRLTTPPSLNRSQAHTRR
jgi:hypothetical protein